MREIKFRAWDKRENEWLTPDQGNREWPSLLAIGLHVLPIAIDKDSLKGNEITAWNIDHYVIIEQWTGRVDKNGKDIYEGDILKINEGAVVLKHEGPVEYYGAGFSVDFGINKENPERWGIGGVHPGDIEVVGNIHENSETITEAINA